MADHLGRTIVSKIMAGLKHNSQKIARDTALPHHKIIRLIHGDEPFTTEIAEKFSNAFPEIEITKDDWMDLKRVYDNEKEPDPPNHPGWFVTRKIMAGYYDSEGAFKTPNSRELAEILGVEHDEVLDLIHLKSSMNQRMADKLEATFPNVGISSDEWMEMQTNYKPEEEPEV